MERNDPHILSASDDSIERACEWLAKIDRELTNDEEESLQTWLLDDSSHSLILFECAQTWDKMHSLNKLVDIFPCKIPAPPLSFGMRVTKAFIMVIAITVIGMMGAHYHGQLSQSLSTENDYVFQTAIGEQSTVNMIDGSQVILNTNSLIEVEFKAEERKVSLMRGEIYVKVAHDVDRPFNVYIGDKIIKAVGTEFNIKITEDNRIEVIVTDGKVLVTVMDKGNAIPVKTPVSSGPQPVKPMPLSSGESILLGDKISVDDTKRVAPEEIEVKLSWRGGNLVFHGEPLEEVLGQIERYTQVEFVIMDDNLKKIRIAGHFKAGDVDGLLKNLRQNFDISYQMISNEKVILSRN